MVSRLLPNCIRVAGDVTTVNALAMGLSALCAPPVGWLVSAAGTTGRVQSTDRPQYAFFGYQLWSVSLAVLMALAPLLWIASKHLATKVSTSGAGARPPDDRRGEEFSANAISTSVGAYEAEGDACGTAQRRSIRLKVLSKMAALSQRKKENIGATVVSWPDSRDICYSELL